MRGAVGGGLVAAVAAIWVAVAPAGAHSASLTVTAAAPPTPVVVIAVPDLRWADVMHMPQLRSALGAAAVGNLSVRSEGDETRCGAGLLEISAGTRVRSDDSPCAGSVVDIATERRRNRSSIFAGHVGALGSALAAAGRRTAVVGETAAPMLADEQGHVGATVDSVAAGLAVADVVGAVDDELVGPRNRAAARAALDSELQTQLGQVFGRATVIIVGSSDGSHGPAHLHVAAIIGFKHRALTSASTHRASYVQLIDVAPTILSLEHIDVPDVMVGRPMHTDERSAASLATLVDDDRHARAAADVGGPTRNTLAVVLAVVLVGWLLEIRGSHLVARLLLAAPAMTYLVQLVPWWRWGTGAYIAIVAAGALAFAVVVSVTMRASTTWALLAGPVFTSVALAVDQLVGAPLQLSAPTGDNPLVAGRFHGMGNVAFGLMCSAVLFIAGLLAARARKTVDRIMIVGGLSIVALIIDGAPMLGDDLGGVLSLLPSAMLLAALVLGLRLTWRRIAVGAGVVVAAAVGLAFADYARPESQQTHVGQFVGHVLHGGSDPVLRRKVRAAIRSVGNVALDVPVVVALSALVTGRIRRRVDSLQLTGVDVALVGCGVLAALGSLLNDSGVVVAAAVLLAVCPPVMSVSPR